MDNEEPPRCVWGGHPFSRIPGPYQVRTALPSCPYTLLIILHGFSGHPCQVTAPVGSYVSAAYWGMGLTRSIVSYIGD